MATDVPVTIYRATDGLGEMGQSDDASITTLSSLEITTLSGLGLIINEGEFTPLASTTWIEDDDM